ncbi:MAG TPA: hypothetical protein VFA04_16470 [Bryobacteraceae bacterium]|nr:hypothetical protein [Bryobacteraceae bacterium]
MKGTHAFVLITALSLRLAQASGHGPVFALATPTNPRGGFSFDSSVMGRYGMGGGTMYRGTLGYGVTENFKVSLSAPIVFQQEPFINSRTASTTPMGGDFEALGLWRFQRRDVGVGKRFETTAIGGLLVPGPQADSGALKGSSRRPGALAGIVSGLASRAHYVWAGATYQRYAQSRGERRPDLLFYSFAYAYRPESWRKDNGWDWRIFGECTGERAGALEHAGVDVPGSRGNQVFAGPTALGVYKNYAVSGGVQFAVYQDVAPIFPRERVRVAVNLTWFF